MKKKESNYHWIEIRKDYELHSLSYKKLSRMYGPHPKTIAYHSKKEGWVRGGMLEDIAAETRVLVNKSVAELNADYDKLYNKLTNKVKDTLKTGEVLEAAVINFHASSLKVIRGERMDIRGELTSIQKKKHELDQEKFKHKKWLDKENLKIKKDKKKPVPVDNDDSEYVD